MGIKLKRRKQRFCGYLRHGQISAFERVLAIDRMVLFCCVVKFLFFTIFPCSSTKIIVNANPLYGWIIICFSTTPVNSKFPQILKCKNYTYVRTKTCGVQYFLILLLILWYQFTEVGTSLF